MFIRKCYFSVFLGKSAVSRGFRKLDGENSRKMESSRLPLVNTFFLIYIFISWGCSTKFLSLDTLPPKIYLIFIVTVLRWKESNVFSHVCLLIRRASLSQWKSIYKHSKIPLPHPGPGSPGSVSQEGPSRKKGPSPMTPTLLSQYGRKGSVETAWERVVCSLWEGCIFFMKFISKF